MSTTSSAPPAFETVAELLKRLGDIPPHRVRLIPTPGTATEKDVLEAEARHNRLCELVDGVLVEKTMGYEESLLAMLLGYFLTDGNAGLRRAAPDFEQRIAARAPAGRWGDPAADIGAAALYLVSPAAAYANGSVLTVDGGLTAVL